jgi:tRNA/tmRNA/rRNA uracil-C5-methylase (TrmA/RlmC/RlmD family)
VNAKVEDFVGKIGSEFIIDNSQLTIVLDPPRDGMHPSALPYILSFGASEIVYVSCNPATLARDIEIFI